MGDKSKIEWTEATWNPVRGCTKISPGCTHCYAETFAERFRGVSGHPYEQGFDLRAVPEHLEDPLRWTRPRRIFVNSMSDLFHAGVARDYIGKVWDVMRRADWHTYQVLTKRADLMGEWLSANRDAAAAKHVWWGVSVEDRKHGLPRIDALRAAQSRNAFLSIEPLIEDLIHVDLRKIDWLIIGGESGPGARRCDVRWIRKIIADAEEYLLPVFVKQLGANVVDRNDAGFEGDSPGGWPMDTHTEELVHQTHQGAPIRVMLRSRKGADMAEWPEDLRRQEMPA